MRSLSVVNKNRNIYCLKDEQFSWDLGTSSFHVVGDWEFTVVWSFHKIEFVKKPFIIEGAK